jgi:hemerythrin-like domain-containing protein
MSDALISPGPDFDQPVAALKHCHDRIRKQLQTLERLLQHLHQEGNTVDAQQASAAVLRYFNEAAPNHHADEEEDLLPMLTSTVAGADADTLAAMMPQVLNEHRQMEDCWQRLAPQLQAVANGQGKSLDEAEAKAFAALYTEHMEREEGTIAPMAKRIFSAEQMQKLGNAMRARRGIPVGGTDGNC